MQGVTRPYAAAGIFLLGASVIATTPVLQSPGLGQGLKHTSDAEVRLVDVDAAAVDAAALPDLTLQDLENIPYNFLASIVNLPYYEFSAPIDTATVASGEIAYTLADPGVGVTPIPPVSDGAIGLLDNVLNYEGNFFLLDAVNVLGIDPGDPGKIAAFADILSGNPEVGSAVAGQLIPILEAELPLQAGCTAVGAGGCPDPLEILMGSNQSIGFDPLGSNNLEVPGYFSVPIQDFMSANGYTFPGTMTDPLLNPVPSSEVEPFPAVFPPGTPTDPIVPADGQYYEVLPWSGENVNFNDLPNAGSAYFDYLTQNPADNPIMLPSLTDVTTDLNNLTTGLFNTFNPFVPDTFCLICAPFVPGDTDLQTFLTTEGQEITTNFSSFLSELESGFGGGAAGDLSTLLGGTDLTSLFDPSLSTDLTQLLDFSALPSDFSALPSDLTALLASTLPDLVSAIPF